MSFDRVLMPRSGWCVRWCWQNKDDSDQRHWPWAGIPSPDTAGYGSQRQGLSFLSFRQSLKSHLFGNWSTYWIYRRYTTKLICLSIRATTTCIQGRPDCTRLGVALATNDVASELVKCGDVAELLRHAATFWIDCKFPKKVSPLL